MTETSIRKGATFDFGYGTPVFFITRIAKDTVYYKRFACDDPRSISKADLVARGRRRIHA